MAPSAVEMMPQHHTPTAPPSPAIPLQLGLYHPEFMFCGECSNCDTGGNEEKKDDSLQASSSATQAAAVAALAPQKSSIEFSTTPQQEEKGSGLVRSTLAVQGVCCSSEVPQVRAILHPWRVQISIATKRVYVHHPAHVPAADLCSLLSNSGFPSQCLRSSSNTATTNDSNVNTAANGNVNGNSSNENQAKRSLFVESTVQVSNLTPALVSRVVEQHSGRFELGAVRAIHASIASHTAKVEHDPNQINLRNICTILKDEFEWDATVLIDGAVEQLYLPMSEAEELQQQQASNPSSTPMNATTSSSADAATLESSLRSHRQLQLHVILSGIFWFISITAAFSTGWYRHAIYAGLLSVASGLPPVAKKAFKTFQRRQFDANCMMVIAALGACLLGEFDEAASVSFLFCVSEFLEARAASSARSALAEIVQLRPEHAHVIMPAVDSDNDSATAATTTGSTVITPASQVRVGSLIRVRTGDKIAADGVVVEGTSSLDQSSLTGESVPVLVTAGSTVSGGSINIGNTQLIVRTTATSEDSAVSRLIRLVEDAQANVSPTEKMVDSFARAYTPVVISMAVLLATVPWLWGIEQGRYWTLNGLILIVIACPCALTISTPVTYAAGLAATAQRGIVCKGGATLEALGSVTSVVLDKTGTITQGRFAVSALQVIGESRTRHEMLVLLALMEAPSSHPLSATLVQAAKREGVVIPKEMQAMEHSILKGEGVTASISGKQVYVGNKRLFERIGMYNKLRDNHKVLAEQWSSRGGTVGFIGVHGEGIVGSFCMTDVLRPEAKETIELMQLDGINVVMLTGDGQGAASAVAQQVGLPASAVHSQLLPEDKLHFIGSLKSPAASGSVGLFRQQANVLFCGDGVNDAPALAVADVGVSMGEGAALAMEMSDVTLMDSNLKKLSYVMCMGRKVLYTIRQNILMSLLCKALVVALTFWGYMTLLYAIAADVGVMLLVTLNGMRLLPGRNSDLPAHDNKRSSRFRAFWKGYNEVPTAMTPSPSEVELHGEII